MFRPVWALAALAGYGPRVPRSPGLGLIADDPWSAPYEEAATLTACVR
jgi:hypothetical protein